MLVPEFLLEWRQREFCFPAMTLMGVYIRRYSRYCQLFDPLKLLPVSLRNHHVHYPPSKGGRTFKPESCIDSLCILDFLGLVCGMCRRSCNNGYSTLLYNRFSLIFVLPYPKTIADALIIHKKRNQCSILPMY